MSTERSRTGTQIFGRWLSSAIREAGLSQTEFATKVGVSKSSVSRWISGDRPKGDHIEKIADILVKDYDWVATMAGYRPGELLEIDPDSPVAQILPLIERIDWESDPMRLEGLMFQLEGWLRVDRKRKESEQD